MAQGPQAVDPADRSPEEIRRDIEATRADMGTTMTGIEDRVSPSRIRERQAQRVKGRWTNMRESVMGSSQDVAASGRQTRANASQDASQARERLSEAPGQARERTQGNPLAAGLIAFGGGLLVASLLPSSQKEQHAAQELRDRYEEPVKQELQAAGQQAREDLQPRAQQAADEVKQTAQEGAQQVRDDTKQSAQQVRDDAQQSREDMQR